MQSSNKTGKDFMVMVFAKCSTSAIGFITTMLLSRHLTLHEYGSYSQLLLIVQLFVSVFSLGLPNSISYFFPREVNKGKFVSQYLMLVSLIALIIALFAYTGENIFCSFFKNASLKEYLFFVCIYPWALILINSIDNLCIVLGRTKFLAVYKITNALLTAITAAVASFYSLDLRAYLRIFIIIQVLMSAMVYIFASQNVEKLEIYFDFLYIKKIFTFSLPIGLSAIVGTINAEIDKLVISYYETTEAVAVYSNCSKELPFALIAAALTSLLLPKLVIYLSQNNKDKAIRIWNNSAEFSFTFMAFIVCLLIVFSKEVITFLYSGKFLSGTDIYYVYSCLLLLRFTYFGMFLNAGGKSKSILYSSIVSVMVNIILDIILYHAFGVIGPAIATFVSQIIMNLLQLILTCKNFECCFAKILPWKRIGFCSLINSFLLAGAMFLRLKIQFFDSIGGIVLLLLIWIVIEGAVFGKRELELFKNMD